MSVPAFIDITEAEQTAEIRAFLKSLGADISEENVDGAGSGLEKDLHEVIEVCDICFQEASEADTESVFNGIVSLVVMVHVDQSENLILTFCDKLTKAPSTKLALVCMRVLSNLFHGLDECSPLRYNVYYNLIKVAGQTENIHGVFTDIDKMKQWMQHCSVSTEKLQKVMRLLHEVLLECKQSELASKVMIELLSTYTEDNASQARDDAHRCIVASLGDPNTFLLDHLLTLKPVKFLEGELIHDLLTIFVSDKLSSYIQFYSTNKEFVDSLGLVHEQNLQKMRFLTFMQIAENKKEIPFEMLQQELQIGPNEVELFVIDALRTKMVRAKLDQMNGKVIVSSTIHRTFGKPQWQYLREILAQWKSNIAVIQENMESVINVRYEQATAQV